MAKDMKSSSKETENDVTIPPQIHFVDKITLPRDNQYQRVSLIYGSFWLPLPERHSIVVVSLSGTIERKVEHKFIRQPKIAVESVLKERILIGASTGLFCMSADDSGDCRIIADGNICDISTSKNYICAYEFTRKVVLVFRRANSDWVKCEVVRLLKEVFQRLLFEDDIIFVQFEGFRVCTYSKRGEFLQQIQMEKSKGSRSPKNALRLCRIDNQKSWMLTNWYNHSIEIYTVPSGYQTSPGASDKQETSLTLDRLSIKLAEVKNPNDFVVSGEDDLYILGGNCIVHCKLVR